MTISNAIRTAGPFPGNGVTKSFPFSYKVYAREDVLVALTNTSSGVETVLTLDADYTVKLNPDQNSSPGGIIVMTAAPPPGTTLAATSNIPIVQTLDLTNGGGFYPRVINDALDRLVINVQQLAARVGLGNLNVGMSAAVANVLGFVANLAASTGSSLVGFLQSGAGAIVRTVLDELRDRASVKQFGAKGNGATNDTAAFVKAVTSGAKRIYVPDGTYLVDYNSIVLPEGVEIYGPGTLKCIATPASAPNVASPYFLRVTKNNSVRGLKFIGAQNRLYAVVGLSSASLGQVKNIVVDGISTDKAGVFMSQPELGFTFNDGSYATDGWIYKGPVSLAHIASNITVSNCVMYGDPTYKPSAGNTNGNDLAHGVAFLYSTDCRSVNNYVSNTRFGNWAYGGSAVAADNLSVAANPLWNRNISFVGGVAREVFSGFWMARTNNGSITGTITDDFQDVTVDFEGCEGCTATGNTTITKTVGGGSLTALFGCSDIVFSGNVCRFETTAISSNMINSYVGNNRIKYVNNTLTNLSAGVPKVIIRNRVSAGGTLSPNKSSDITFSGNTLERVDLLIEDVDSAYVTDNHVTSPTSTNAIYLYNVPACVLLRNTLTLSTASALNGQSTSPVQAILNGMTYAKIVIKENEIYGTSGDSGLTVFGAMAASCVADISRNRVKTIFLDNSFIFFVTNQNRGRVRFLENVQPYPLDSEHIGMSVLKSITGSELANPFITYANAAPTVGTYKQGDIVYFAVPNAGGSIGMVCTVGGTPGTWKNFGSIAA